MTATEVQAALTATSDAPTLRALALQILAEREGQTAFIDTLFRDSARLKKVRLRLQLESEMNSVQMASSSNSGLLQADAVQNLIAELLAF